jgi:hypothetical protein
MTAPKIFISYSHDTQDHKAWVLKLGSNLLARGVDVVLDRWDLAPGQDMSMFMQRGIAEADRVLMICSATYVQKAEAGLGGVGYERLIVTAELIQSIDTIKFIPIMRLNPQKTIPIFIGPRLNVDFNDDTKYAPGLDQLTMELHGVSGLSKPPLGVNPFSGKPTGSSPTRSSGSTSEILGSPWFSDESDKAKKGIGKLGLVGYMEIRVATSSEITKSQIELLNAVRQSEIQTFGWPIGVILNKDEFRPRPYGNGIRAEVAVSPSTSNGRTSYDYWSLRFLPAAKPF